MRFPGDSNGKGSACNARNLGLIPGSGRSPGEGNGSPLQYSCLENPLDRGAWRAAVHGVAKSWTWLSDFFHFHLPRSSSFCYIFQPQGSWWWSAHRAPTRSFSVDTSQLDVSIHVSLNSALMGAGGFSTSFKAALMSAAPQKQCLPRPWWWVKVGAESRARWRGPTSVQPSLPPCNPDWDRCFVLYWRPRRHSLDGGMAGTTQEMMAETPQRSLTCSHSAASSPL